MKQQQLIHLIIIIILIIISRLTINSLVFVIVCRFFFLHYVNYVYFYEFHKIYLSCLFSYHADIEEDEEEQPWDICALPLL